MATHHSATIEDLYREEGKAELVGGEIVRMSPAGRDHGKAALSIAASLREHQRSHGLSGTSFGDNVGFLCNLPDRQSFSPDAAYYTGPVSGDEDFLPHAPDFAAEIRSKGDYGPAADRKIAQKQSNYFAAGTKVVWDVKLRSGEIWVYRATDPDNATVYHRGETAEAEPAVPGWTMPVDEVFE
jgi:Uma2 family endonuclease